MCWALFARNVKPDLDPKLFWLTLADEELTGFFIFAAFSLWSYHYGNVGLVTYFGVKVTFSSCSISSFNHR